MVGLALEVGVEVEVRVGVAVRFAFHGGLRLAAQTRATDPAGASLCKLALGLGLGSGIGLGTRVSTIRVGVRNRAWDRIGDRV